MSDESVIVFRVVITLLTTYCAMFSRQRKRILQTLTYFFATLRMTSGDPSSHSFPRPQQTC